MAEERNIPEFRYRPGRPLKYTPKQLAEKFVEYVKWAEDNPIVKKTITENTSVSGAKYGSEVKDKIPRLVSVGGFLVFLGASRSWWSMLDAEAKHADEFLVVKDNIRDFCEEYQKNMASAGVFNANIISRLLGLADRQVQTVEPVQIVVKSEEMAEKIRNIDKLG